MRRLSEAFEVACNELDEVGQPKVARESSPDDYCSSKSWCATWFAYGPPRRLRG